MALTVSFAISAPCSGGNHATLTATLKRDGVTIKTLPIAISKQELWRTSPTSDELETTVIVLVRAMLQELSANTTPAQMKNKLEAKTLDLTLV
jgi:hypothetical protein